VEPLADDEPYAEHGREHQTDRDGLRGG